MTNENLMDANILCLKNSNVQFQWPYSLRNTLQECILTFVANIILVVSYVHSIMPDYLAH